jgi:hypothetical protein
VVVVVVVLVQNCVGKGTNGHGGGEGSLERDVAAANEWPRNRIEIDRVFLAGCCADPEGPEARPACGWLGVILIFFLARTDVSNPSLGRPPQSRWHIDLHCAVGHRSFSAWIIGRGLKDEWRTI